MKYIYVNGDCARELLIANQKDQQTAADTGSWLSNPAAVKGTSVGSFLSSTVRGPQTINAEQSYTARTSSGLRYSKANVNWTLSNVSFS